MPSKKIFNDDQSFEAISQSQDSLAGNYSVITYRDRIRLIQMICLEKQRIMQAASSIGIKISTAKYILRCFRKNGKILRKSCESKELEESLQKQIQDLKNRVDQLSKNRRTKKQKLKRIEQQKKLLKVESNKENKTEEIDEVGLDNAQNQRKQQKIQQNIAQAYNIPVMNQFIPYLYFYNPFWANSNQLIIKTENN